MTGKFGVLLAAAAKATGTGGFTVDASPPIVVSVGPESAAVTATPSGGTGPYTYSWSMKAGSSVAIHIREPSAAMTTFYCFDSGGEKQGRAVCAVQDDTGAIAFSNDVTVILLTGSE